jgi:ABC-type transport system involved in multi-copper enzyme maturation permease subunit
MIMSTTVNQPSTKLRLNWLWGVVGVAKLEIQRSLTTARILTWLAMVLFPVTIVALTVWQIHQFQANFDEAQKALADDQSKFAFSMMLYVLLPQVVTPLGLLLWATPVVSSELEGQTWIYAVTRANGRRAVLLGKYFVAVVWSCSSSIVSASIAIPITGMQSSVLAWFVIVGLILLSSVAYAALFVLIGTLFQRRAMITAFVYMIGVETFLSLVPATINQLTVSFRLRSILFQSMELEITSANQRAQWFLDTTPVWQSVCYLGLYAVILLSISLWRVQASQYTWQSEL